MQQADVKRMVGDALRVALSVADVSQTALARGIGKPPGTVSAWVNAANLVSVTDVVAIDKYLGCHLLDDAGVTEPRTLLEAISADEALDDQGRDDLRACYERAITETARRRVAEVSCDGDTTQQAPALVLAADLDDTTPAVLLLLQLFGRERVRKLASELASAAAS